MGEKCLMLTAKTGDEIQITDNLILKVTEIQTANRIRLAFITPDGKDRLRVRRIRKHES